MYAVWGSQFVATELAWHPKLHSQPCHAFGWSIYDFRYVSGNVLVLGWAMHELSSVFAVNA